MIRPEWRVEFDADAAKELRKIGTEGQRRILRFLRERIAAAEDPRQLGSALTGEFAGLWRYRVGDYRIIASIEDRTVTVLVLKVGHRRDIYR
ncbi:MAG: type II toxin-antitoxin system RelE family toxin [Hyphomicrobiales bacterium]